MSVYEKDGVREWEFRVGVDVRFSNTILVGQSFFLDLVYGHEDQREMGYTGVTKQFIDVGSSRSLG